MQSSTRSPEHDFEVGEIVYLSPAIVEIDWTLKEKIGRQFIITEVMKKGVIEIHEIIDGVPASTRVMFPFLTREKPDVAFYKYRGYLDEYKAHQAKVRRV